MTGYLILGAIGGALLGYFVFYLRYQHRDTVNELRGNLKEANREIQHLQSELEENIQQNVILKEKVTELLDKNDDLSDVVSELSKYYVHLKKAAEKTTELSKYLQDPNPNIEEKMNHYVNLAKEKSHEPEEKKFF